MTQAVQIANIKPVSSRHRWGDKVRFPLAHKSETPCLRCDMVRVGRRECPAGKDIYWTEFWRDGDRIPCEPGKTPPCDARLERERAGIGVTPLFQAAGAA